MRQEILTACLPEEFYKVRGGSFSLKPIQDIFQSNFVPDSYRFGAARFMRWVCEVELVPQNRDGWQRFEAFMVNANQRPYAFELYHPGKALPLGVGAGFDPSGTNQPIQNGQGGQNFLEGGLFNGATSCLVKQKANRGANSIVVEGLPASKVILKSGDHFSLSGNLYMVLGDTLSNADGEARLTFADRLHKAAVVRDRVNFRKPKGRFILIDPESGVVSLMPSKIGTATLHAVEMPHT